MLHKNVVDEVVHEARVILVELSPVINTTVDTENMYDIHINLGKKRGSVPYAVAVSYDEDAGYFIDIDDATWEFQHDAEAFRLEAIELFNAIIDKRVRITKRKFLKVINTGTTATIVGISAKGVRPGSKKPKI